MNTLQKRSISIAFVTMLILGMAAIYPTKAQPATLSINPALNHFETGTTPVGAQFHVFVDITDVTNMFAYQFTLTFDNTMIQLVGPPKASVPQPGAFLTPVDPAAFFIPAWNLATGSFAYTLLAPELGQSGSGFLVDFTFQILRAPDAFPGSMLTTPIELTNVKIVDPSAIIIPVTIVNGVYEYAWTPPAITQFVSVNPALTTKGGGAPIVGTANAFFTVFVDANQFPAGWSIVGVQFTLSYNSTLLHFESMAVDPFLDSVNPGNIYMVPVIEGVDPVTGLATLTTAVVVLPQMFPPSVWTQTIAGTGHLVDVTFSVIMQEAFPWTATSPLNLSDVLLSNTLGEAVDMLPPVNGAVLIKGFILGRSIDVYTQYPDPFGGQGPNNPSDMFWPQKEVELCANVTYNLWPVQNKIVSFQVVNAAGETVAVLTAISDENGVACTSFRIPWPCFDTSALFGIWNVIATVDIASTVVNDTLQFHFDYLVNFVNVTVDPTAVAHLGIVKVTIDYQTFAIQHYNVVFAAMITDELNYPIGSAYAQVTIGDLDMAAWCQPAPGQVVLEIPIPKWAAAGIATVHVNAFSDFPWNGGSALTPEFAPAPTITILPL